MGQRQLPNGNWSAKRCHILSLRSLFYKKYLVLKDTDNELVSLTVVVGDGHDVRFAQPSCLDAEKTSEKKKIVCKGLTEGAHLWGLCLKCQSHADLLKLIFKSLQNNKKVTKNITDAASVSPPGRNSVFL